MLEETKVWQDANESLTQMCEDGKIKNRLRSEMMQLDSPKSQKRLKEIQDGNNKTVLHEIVKEDNFMGTFVWAIFSLCSIFMFSNARTLVSVILHFFQPLERSGASST
jgi:hypothetical protein